MTSIVLYEFGGMLPRLGEEFLPDIAAIQASNCNLLSGELRPLHAPVPLFNFVPPTTHRSEFPDPEEPEPPDYPSAESAYNACLDSIFRKPEYGGTGLNELLLWIDGELGIQNDGGDGNETIIPEKLVLNFDPGGLYDPPGVGGGIAPDFLHDIVLIGNPDKQQAQLASAGQTWNVVPPSGALSVDMPNDKIRVLWPGITDQVTFDSEGEHENVGQRGVTRGWPYEVVLEVIDIYTDGVGGQPQTYNVWDGDSATGTLEHTFANTGGSGSTVYTGTFQSGKITTQVTADATFVGSQSTRDGKVRHSVAVAGSPR